MLAVIYSDMGSSLTMIDKCDANLGGKKNDNAFQAIRLMLLDFL